MRTGTSLLFLLSTLILLSRSAYAGKLDDFEADIDSEKDKKESSCRGCGEKRHKQSDQDYDRHSYDDNDHHDRSLAGDIIDGFFSALFSSDDEDSSYSSRKSEDVGSSGYSSDREKSSEWDEEEKPGDLLAPYIRADIAYRPVDNDIIAREQLIEVGVGAFAAHFNTSRYEESDPPDKLDLDYAFGMLRVPFTSSGFEIDYGVGRLTINGNENHSYAAYTLPVRYQPNEKICLEFRPMWTDEIKDYDAAVLAGFKYFSVKAGYRWVATSGTSLNGSYIGVSLHY